MRVARLGVVFEIEPSETRSGLIVFRAVGPRAAELFRDEPGGHR
jgi:hypothetical protein